MSPSGSQTTGSNGKDYPSDLSEERIHSYLETHPHVIEKWIREKASDDVSSIIIKIFCLECYFYNLDFESLFFLF